jgi:hypothetical protein
MRRRFVTLDVFTARRFAGNPLAVVLDAEQLETPDMQAIAQEFNHPETVFVFASGDPAHRARIRIFTPRRELPFAGHPTIGTAVLLGLRDGGGVGRDIVLEEPIGAVHCTLETTANGEVAPASLSRNCRSRSGRSRRTPSLRRRWGWRRPRSASCVRRAGRPGCPSHSLPSARGQRSSVAVPISPDSTARSARVARPMYSAARPLSPAMVFMPACSRPAWASRKTRPRAPRLRLLPACSLRTCPTGRTPSPSSKAVRWDGRA